MISAQEKLEYRQGNDADAEAILKLTRDAYAKWVPIIGREPLPMTADYIEALKTHRFDLILANGVLIALIETIAAPNHLLIENLAVSQAWQGRGLGRQLVQQVETLASDSGRFKIRLYTNKKFIENLAFYKSLGYTITREEEFRGGITVHFHKRLDPQVSGGA